MNKQKIDNLVKLKLLRATFFTALILAFSVFIAGNVFGQKTLKETKHPSFTTEVTGYGKPMILIPGLASSGEVWESTVARYKANYECHVLTLAGFAGQPAIKAPFLEKVRNDLAAYIVEKKLKKPTIVGHSLGGFTALWLASTEPDLVGSLIIVDSLPFLPAALNPNAAVETMKPQAEEMRKAMIARGAFASTLTTEEQRRQMQKMNLESLKPLVTDSPKLELVAKWGQNSDPETVAQAMYEMNTTDLRGDIAHIKSPTLVIGTWIGYQQYTSRERVEKVFQEQYAKLKGFRFVMSERGKHFVMYDDPKLLFSEMDAFLANPGEKVKKQ